MIFFSYVSTIIGIGFLILIHELGHFIFSKLFNIPVAEFKIGRGPELFSKNIGETTYSLGVLPLGGYVAVGESNNHEKEVNLLNEKPLYQGILVILGGILNNIIFAYIVITFVTVFYSNSIPTTPLKNFIPQTSITLKHGEETLNADYRSVYELFSSIEKGKKLKIKNEESTRIISLEEFKKSYIIENGNFYSSKTLLSRIGQGIILTTSAIKATMLGLITSLCSVNFKNFSGPVGIIKTCSTAAQQGTPIFLIFLALISISLAILNLLPIPIVDGGQLLLLLVRKLYKKDLPESFQAFLTYGSFAILGIITLYSTYNDIIRYIFN